MSTRTLGKVFHFVAPPRSVIVIDCEDFDLDLLFSPPNTFGPLIAVDLKLLSPAAAFAAIDLVHHPLDLAGTVSSRRGSRIKIRRRCWSSRASHIVRWIVGSLVDALLQCGICAASCGHTKETRPRFVAAERPSPQKTEGGRMPGPFRTAQMSQISPCKERKKPNQPGVGTRPVVSPIHLRGQFSAGTP